MQFSGNMVQSPLLKAGKTIYMYQSLGDQGYHIYRPSYPTTVRVIRSTYIEKLYHMGVAKAMIKVTTTIMTKSS